MFPDIKPKEASLKLEIPYTKSFANSFYRMKNLPPNTLKKKKVPKSIPPQDTTQEALRFIDDPNELLMSCAIRELNKLNPEVRWATILVNILKETKQLETISKERSEAQSKLKQYSTTDLISLRKKLTGNLLEDG